VAAWHLTSFVNFLRAIVEEIRTERSFDAVFHSEIQFHYSNKHAYAWSALAVAAKPPEIYKYLFFRQKISGRPAIRG
jgi:hypothetical protein